MSSEISDVDVDRAKAWCRKARELIGRWAIMGDARQMKSFNESIATNLKELNRLGLGGDYQVLGQEYRRISQLAKEAEEAGDDPATRALIAEMGVLESEIQVAISFRLSERLQNERTLFKRRKPLVETDLEGLQKIADADTYRRLKMRFNSIVALVEKTDDDYPVANPKLKKLGSEVRESLGSFEESAKLWGNVQSRRDAVQRALDALDRSSPWHHTIDKLYKASTKSAETLHIYDSAYRLLEQAEAAVEQQKAEHLAIEKKIDAFRKEDPTLLQLQEEVSERIQRLFTQYRDEQRNRGKDVAEKDFAAMGGLGARFVRACNIFGEYRTLAETPIYEGWSGYPNRTDNATGELNEINDQLKQIGSDRQGNQNYAIDLIKEQQERAYNQNRLKIWAGFASETQTALDKLAENVGATSPDYTTELARFESFREKWNADRSIDQVKLKKLISDINKRLGAEADARKALQEKRLELRDKWNELLDACDIFPKAYYDGLSNEYDSCNSYLDSNNTEIVELGLQKRQALLDRFQAAIDDPESTKQGSLLLLDIKAKIANPDLEAFQPTNYGLHQYEVDRYEESGVAQTEDPATLLPRLNSLKAAVEASLQKAQEKKSIIAAVESLLDELAPLLTQLDERLDAFCNQSSKRFPPAYQTTFRAGSQLFARYARMVEEPTKASEHQAKLADLKLEMERLLGSSDDLSAYFDDKETARMKSETDRAAALEQERLAYERELAEFERGLLAEVKASHGQMGIWNLFYTDQLKVVKAHLSQMHERAEAEEFSMARSALTRAIVAARQLQASTADSRISSSLEGLDTDWEERVTEMKGVLNALAAQILNSAGQYPSGDATSITAKAQAIASLFADVDASEFKSCLEKILAEERTDQKEVAEKALELTRRRFRLVDSNPLLQKLIDNPFDVAIRPTGLRKVLRQLELSLLTVR